MDRLESGGIWVVTGLLAEEPRPFSPGVTLTLVEKPPLTEVVAPPLVETATSPDATATLRPLEPPFASLCMPTLKSVPRIPAEPIGVDTVRLEPSFSFLTPDVTSPYSRNVDSLELLGSVFISLRACSETSQGA